MTLLALDLGTTTGFCIGNALPGTSGTMSFAAKSRFEGGGMRYLRFRRWLDELVSLHPISEIAFEEVRGHKGTDASHVYGGFMGQLTAWCEERSIPYSGVPVGTIKIHWCGKGNVNKAAMIAESQRRGLSPADDNEADAQALFSYQLSQRTPPIHSSAQA